MSDFLSIDQLSEMRANLAGIFDLLDEEIDVQGHTIRMSSVANVDQLLDRHLAKEESHVDIKDERIPYWAEMWPSAIALGEYILSHEYLTAERQVLEIGCGLGFAGIAAGKVASRVILTDYLQEPLHFAAYNWAQNHRTHPNCHLMDWRYPIPELASDLVLASDVAYESRAFEPLIQSFAVLMKPDAKLLIAEPGRRIASPFRQMVQDLDVEVKMNLVPVQYGNISNRIHIFEISRQNLSS